MNSKKDKYFWICGKHSVLEALKNPLRKINIVALADNQKNLLNNEILKKCPTTVENISFFNKKFGIDFPHQGIAASIQPLPYEEVKLQELSKIKNIIALDGINDPRNIGAIIRSAVSYEWNNILVNKHDFNIASYALYKAASGAMEHIKLLISSNIFNDIKYLKKNDFWIIGMSSHSNHSLYDYEDLNKKVIIFGSEKKGIRNYLEKYCDITYHLPISKKIDSLNVSCATSSTLAVLDYIKKKPAKI